jgi:hypothetical protein
VNRTHGNAIHRWPNLDQEDQSMLGHFHERAQMSLTQRDGNDSGIIYRRAQMKQEHELMSKKFHEIQMHLRHMMAISQSVFDSNKEMKQWQAI